MDEVWVFVEHKGGLLLRTAFELLERARTLAHKLQAPLAAVLLADSAAAARAADLIYAGADRVRIVEDDRLAHFDLERYARLAQALVEEVRPAIILAAASTSGRTLMPYLAQRLETGLTADCTLLDIEEGTGALLQTRPAIGGNIMATIKTPSARPQMATVRPRSSPPAALDRSRRGELIRHTFDDRYYTSRVTYLGFEPDSSQELPLQEAEKIVSGGKGLKTADNFIYLRELAEALGAAVGASREAVDKGWIAYPHQIGLSGKTVSPRLYLCAGISGAVQHLAGMQTAETVVAINSDPDAQIFKVADLGVVADLFAILPRLAERIRQVRGERERAERGSAGD